MHCSLLVFGFFSKRDKDIHLIEPPEVIKFNRMIRIMVQTEIILATLTFLALLTFTIVTCVADTNNTDGLSDGSKLNLARMFCELIITVSAFWNYYEHGCRFWIGPALTFFIMLDSYLISLAAASAQLIIDDCQQLLLLERIDAKNCDSVTDGFAVVYSVYGLALAAHLVHFGINTALCIIICLDSMEPDVPPLPQPGDAEQGTTQAPAVAKTDKPSPYTVAAAPPQDDDDDTEDQSKEKPKKKGTTVAKEDECSDKKALNSKSSDDPKSPKVKPDSKEIEKKKDDKKSLSGPVAEPQQKSSDDPKSPNVKSDSKEIEKKKDDKKSKSSDDPKSPVVKSDSKEKKTKKNDKKKSAEKDKAAKPLDAKEKKENKKKESSDAAMPEPKKSRTPKKENKK